MRFYARYNLPDRVPALISFRDPEMPPVKRECPTLDLPCRDDASMRLDTAGQIDAFIELHGDAVVQCEHGLSRSQAVAAAFATDPAPIIERFTYNRHIYRLLAPLAGKTLQPDPLVSVVVRLKHGIETCVDSVLSGRYKAHEVLQVSDGPADFATWSDDRAILIQTPERKGHWGHPYRQLGIDQAAGEYIVVANDDNYYVPGFLEQMLYWMRKRGADMALCNYLNAYTGWNVCEATVDPWCADLGCFVVKRELIRQVKWEWNDFFADMRFFQALAKRCQTPILRVCRPLFIKN